MTDGDAELAERLRRAFSDLPPIGTPLCLGEGFNSIVFEAGGIVIRIGRNEESAASYERQVRLLHAIRSQIPVSVPYPEWWSSRSPAFPRGVMAYRVLHGRPLEPASISSSNVHQLADGMGSVLAALHRFPRSEADELEIPRWDARIEARERKGAILAVLRDELTSEEYAEVCAWWESFEVDETLGEYRPQLIHGDLWHENLLVDEEATRLVGVLDFEDARLGDVAQDFATLRYLGDGFVHAVIDAYVAHGGYLGSNIERRVQRHWEYRELPILPALTRAGDVGELADSIRKLREGPILSAPRGGRAAR